MLAGVFVIFGCARNPATGKREFVLISESQEIAMGAQADQQARREYGVVEDAALQDYLKTIGRKLVSVSHRPNLEWQFAVVDSPVVNAFALPGGYVYFTRGILAHMSDEAELAGVLGHEIAHVTARHSVRQLTRAQLAQIGIGVGSVLSPTFGQFGSLAEGGLGLVFLRFSRDAEREADRLGVEYAARGNYDPREMGNFFEVLGRLAQASDRETIPGWLSTHPDPPERAATTRKLAEEWISKLGLRPESFTNDREAYVRRLDGMVYGDDPREGFAEGSRFYHPNLNFQIDFPADWKIDNTKSAVLVSDPQQGAQIQLTIAESPAGTTVEDYVRALTNQGLRPEIGDVQNINGNRAFLGVYQVEVQGGTLPAVVAFIEYRGAIYELIGLCRDLQQYRSILERSFRTFRALADARARGVMPDRLRAYVVKPGETLSSIARRLSNPRVTADTLAILNRLAVDMALTPGRVIKIVEKGY